MKKIIISVLVLIFLISGSSCSTKENTSLVSPIETSSNKIVEITELTSTEETTEETTNSDEIKWSDAINHVGEYATVVGKVKSVKYASYSSGSPTFINIGEDYPSYNRFSAVIWGENRSNCYSMLEQIDYNYTVAIYGYIENYNGVAQIEVSSPSDIEIR